MKYEFGSIGLGVLSWRGHQSLEQVMNSFKREEFFGLFDERLIFLPDPDDEMKAVALQYPLRIEIEAENKGILAGMEEIARRLTTDYVFFIENDCPLIESRIEAERQIRKALSLLHTGQACVARMRHVKKYGEPFETITKYRKYYPNPDTLNAKFWRALRSGKAKRLAGTAIYGEKSPDLKFPEYIETAGNDFYLVDAAVLPWTNNSIIVNRQFFLETIIPFCHAAPLGRTVNGFRNLEIELNRSDFWTKSGWKIACGPGLLTHDRVDDRGY